MAIILHVTSEDAELILFALALRSKQKGLSEVTKGKAIGLGEYLDRSFTEYFGWDKLNRMRHYRKPIKHVNIKMYDLPPEEK